MKEKELRSLMQGYIQDATQPDVPKITLLDRMMEDIESYTNKRVITSLQPYMKDSHKPLPNVIEDVSEDVNIFGKVSGSQYKELIEGYQNKSGEEFDEWYKSLPNEERAFLSSMFD